MTDPALADTPGTGSAVLVLTGIGRAFATPAGRVPVLDGVDLEIRPGEIVVVTGRSGSGKTTLLTIASGWDRPDVGVVQAPGPLNGTVTWSDIAVVPQALGLLDELTIEENITLPHRLGAPRPRSNSRSHAAASASEVMTDLRIDHLARRFPDEVSLGEQQRAAVARAIVASPQLLVADEPIAHQNAELAKTVMVELRAVVDTGTSCLVATHNEEAFDVADRVLALRPDDRYRRDDEPAPSVRLVRVR